MSSSQGDDGGDIWYVSPLLFASPDDERCGQLDFNVRRGESDDEAPDEEPAGTALARLIEAALERPGNPIFW